MLTPFYPFSWKWEESASQFYDLIPLGEISVTPGMSNAQGMENRKYAPVALPLHLFLTLAPSVYVCYCYRLLHTKLFVCAQKYLCVGVCNPWVLALCLKKRRACVPVISEPLSCIVYLFPESLLAGLNGVLCAEWVSGSEGKADFRLSAGCVCQTLAHRWVTCEEEMTVRDRYHLQKQTAEGLMQPTEAFSPSCTCVTAVLKNVSLPFSLHSLLFKGLAYSRTHMNGAGVETLP